MLTYTNHGSGQYQTGWIDFGNYRFTVKPKEGFRNLEFWNKIILNNGK